MRPVCHYLWFLVLFSLAACPDHGKELKKGSPPDAGLSRPTAIDASALPSRPVAAAMVLDQSCRCGELAVKAPQVRASLRGALVEVMDTFNVAMRRFLESVDDALGPGDAKLPDPKPHREALAGLRCKLDCLLSQLSGYTRPAWAYLEQAARFLDLSGVALSRLSLPPGQRSPGPGGADLAAEFNALAKLSNLSVGLELIEPLKPEPPLALDSLAFRAKTRRWVKATTAILDAHEKWRRMAERREPRAASPPVGGRVGPPRNVDAASKTGVVATFEAAALREPMTFRVAHARLRQDLSSRIREARALRCDRGEACKALSATLAAAVSALLAVIKATQEADTALRAAAAFPMAPGSRAALSGPLEAALKAWTDATEGLVSSP